MRTRTEVWKRLAATGNARVEVRADIAGTPYAEVYGITINRALMANPLTIGNCISATLQFTVRTAKSTVIPKSSKVIIYNRLTEGTCTSEEWLTAGTFYVTNRVEDKVTGQLKSFTCYDAMLKANAPFPSSRADSFPMTARAYVNAVAAMIGVEVDSRTWNALPDADTLSIPYSAKESMREVLGHIGGVCGGNWCITQENKLRMVPLLSSTNAQNAPDSARLDIVGIVGGINAGVGGRVFVSVFTLRRAMRPPPTTRTLRPSRFNSMEKRFDVLDERRETRDSEVFFSSN